MRAGKKSRTLQTTSSRITSPEEYIYPPAPRCAGEITPLISDRICALIAISISGYHIRGSRNRPALAGTRFTIYDGFEYVDGPPVVASPV